MLDTENPENYDEVTSYPKNRVSHMPPIHDAPIVHLDNKHVRLYIDTSYHLILEYYDEADTLDITLTPRLHLIEREVQDDEDIRGEQVFPRFYMDNRNHILMEY
jgi:hypothetical protein